MNVHVYKERLVRLRVFLFTWCSSLMHTVAVKNTHFGGVMRNAAGMALRKLTLIALRK